MKPNQDILQKVSQWLAYANEDLCLARHGLKISEDMPPYRLIAYHAQQCVEKCLKAFLVYHNVDFPFTHNISTLLELCSKHGEWIHQIQEAEILTPYAVTARYPGDDEEVTLEEATVAIDLAHRVRDIIASRLQQ